MATQHISDAEFDAAISQKGKPVLVDFWAEWCGPCKQLSPIIDELAGEFSESLTVAKVNIDNNPESPSRYGVRGIPTLILFRDGKPVATKVGAVPKGQLSEWLRSHLGA